MAPIYLKVTQLKSQIDRPKDQKATLRALRLGKINSQVIHEANEALVGMVSKVSHLVKVEEPTAEEVQAHLDWKAKREQYRNAKNTTAASTDQ